MATVQVGWGWLPSSLQQPKSHHGLGQEDQTPECIRNPPAQQQNSHVKLLNFQLVLQ